MEHGKWSFANEITGDFHRLKIQIHHVESIPSTNTHLKQLAAEGAPEGTCILADEQTAGRGRFDRQWLSLRGAGIYLSILLRPQISTEQFPLISLLGGVAVARALRNITQNTAHITVDIKWPNDVLLNGKKVCGILAEAGFSGGKLAYVVLGVGINLFHETFPEGLIFPPTSLQLELGQKPDAQNVLREFFSALDTSYQALESNPQSFIASWSELSSYAHGKHVSINTGYHMVEGITQSLLTNGALRVQRRDGSVEDVLAGDILKIEN